MGTARQARLGLLADIHYDGGGEAMNRLYEAVAALKAGGVDALLAMGDLVESTGAHNAVRLLREVSALCESFGGPIRYMPGNHDLDHLDKARFHGALGREGDPSRLYFELGGHGVVCLDGNYSPGGTEYAPGNFQWRESFVPEEQLAWLKARLAAAPLPMVVVCHQRLDMDGPFAVGNAAEVREVIRLSGKVQAVFQGHQHADDLRQIDGTTYYTLGAHKDGAGPAVASLGQQAVRLARDFRPRETGRSALAPFP